METDIKNDLLARIAMRQKRIEEAASKIHKIVENSVIENGIGERHMALNPKRDGKQPVVQPINKEVVKMPEKQAIQSISDVEAANFEALKKKLAAKPKPIISQKTGNWYKTDNGNWRLLYENGKAVTVFLDKDSDKWKILYKISKTGKPEVDPELYKDVETAKKIGQETFDNLGGAK